MQIAIASGKGGTGKTTVSTNLSYLATLAGKTVHLLDCDVEEPNCHIFVNPEFDTSKNVCIPVPEVDREKCTACGECSSICQFSAIVCIKEMILTFPELCHGCGGCRRVCPEQAISDGAREVGTLKIGRSDGFRFTQGRLRVGEAMSPPLIREVKASNGEVDLTIIDAPPGTSCPVITAIRGSDFVCLVTEPTPFGLNDLELAVDMVRALGLPLGVVINCADIGDERVAVYCGEQEIPILAEIPEDRQVAEAYCRGDIACRAVPEIRPAFQSLLLAIEGQLKQ